MALLKVMLGHHIYNKNSFSACTDYIKTLTLLQVTVIRATYRDECNKKF